MGIPKNGWFIRDLEMDDDWGYPYFRKPPYMCWVVSTLVSLCFNSSVTFLDVPVTKMLVGDWHKKSRGG